MNATHAEICERLIQMYGELRVLVDVLAKDGKPYAAGVLAAAKDSIHMAAAHTDIDTFERMRGTK